MVVISRYMGAIFLGGRGMVYILLIYLAISFISVVLMIILISLATFVDDDKDMNDNLG